jgi:hypothetical protein
VIASGETSIASKSEFFIIINAFYRGTAPYTSAKRRDFSLHKGVDANLVYQPG